jgi:hypothetical protein
MATLKQRIYSHRIVVCPLCGRGDPVNPLLRGAHTCSTCDHTQRLSPSPGAEEKVRTNTDGQRGQGNDPRIERRSSYKDPEVKKRGRRGN